MKQQIKDIQTYFNLQLSDYDTRKLESILSSLNTVVKVEVPVEKIVIKKVEVPSGILVKYLEGPTPPKDLSKLNLRDLVGQFLHRYRVTLAQVRSGRRIGDQVTRCRTHFARWIAINYPGCSNQQLADFFNLDHTTVVHMLYHTTVKVPVPPLEKKKTNRRCKKQLH